MSAGQSNPAKVVDMHCHVGLVGDEYPHLGYMSEAFRNRTEFKVMLLYGRVKADAVSDRTLRRVTLDAVDGSQVDHVVCLALDPVYDLQGKRQEKRSHMWVDNDYILELQRSFSKKILLGASVHPYDPDFRKRVDRLIQQGAVLLKWLPSAQQINLADARVREAMIYLATAKAGGPLPLLLHCGPEYAIPSTDPRTAGYDCLSWTWWDELANRFRGSHRWYRPRRRRVEANLRAGLEAGAVIIFAHCGLPYYAPNALQEVFEHSEFRTVSRYLRDFSAGSAGGGRCYADVSAMVTPFRRSYFDALRALPPQSLLFGSDFPTPVFELSLDAGEMAADLKAVFQGHLERTVVPEDNLIDVNYHQLHHFFEGHPMFTNFDALL